MYYSQYPQKSRRPRTLSVFAVLIVATLLASGYFIARKTSAHSSHAQTAKIDAARLAAARTTFMNSVNTTISDYSSADIGVSMVDLDEGSQTDVGETASYTAASTTKVLTAVFYLRQVEQGKASLSTVINKTKAQTLIQRMINVSDNSAWADLNEYLGKPQLQAYAQNLGLSSYDSTNNYITAHDDAQLLAKLYQGKLINGAHTRLLYSFMQHTSNDDLIPAGLPAGTTAYHKYGYLGGELHDTAIITYKGHHIVLSIYTKSYDGTLDDYSARTTVFHAIDSAAITYLETR